MTSTMDEQVESIAATAGQGQHSVLGTYAQHLHAQMLVSPAAMMKLNRQSLLFKP